MADIEMRNCWMNAEPAPQTAIRVLQQPGSAGAGNVRLDIDTSVAFTGQCVLRGSPGENIAGWRIGFVQLKHTTADWAEYRGAVSSDGSAFSQMGRAPARPRQLCLDCTAVNRPFYGDDFISSRPQIDAMSDRTFTVAQGVTIPASGKVEIVVSQGDAPERNHDASVPNTQFSPPRTNYLRTLESRAAFITLLAAKDPHGRYHFLKHMYWNIIWQAQFRWDPAAATLTKTSQTGGVNIQRASHSGIPNDPRFAASLRTPVPGSTLDLCNPVAQAAFRNPARMRYARSWQMWNVGS
ncbi:MAG: hypothetical protein R2681_12550 [Pyrinomonadaceae bacterium]